MSDEPVCPREDCDGKFIVVTESGAGWCAECESLFTGKSVGIQRVIDMLEVFRDRTDTTAEADFDDYSNVVQWVYDECGRIKEDDAELPINLKEWKQETTKAIEAWRADGSIAAMPILNAQPHSVESMMVFNTSHLPQEVAARIEAGWLQRVRRLVSAPGLPEPHLFKTTNGSVKAADVIVPSFGREEGWILHVDKDPDFWPDVEELQALFLKAEKAGGCWILFDCDGPVHEDLPTWEW